MPGTVLIGMQWGDEGKAKVVDAVIERRGIDIVARYQGGANAGHTIVFNGKKFVCHLLPSGIVTPNVVNVMGNGMVIDLEKLVKEIGDAKAIGADVSEKNLVISDAAHVTLKYHITEDEKKCKGALGTTGSGIGPTYASKSLREGIRMGDLLTPEYLTERLNKFSQAHPEMDLERETEITTRVGNEIALMICDTAHYLNDALKAGKHVLFEGAQATHLDIDHGTYPYVTSSNATAGGAFTGTGVAPKHLTNCIGILKAYTTRVGEGPCPTELKDDLGESLRKIGNEYGSTTGRPRRCGWLDLVVARESVKFNGVDEIALTKIDVLSSFKEIPICTGYVDPVTKEQYTDRIPSLEVFARVKPIYAIMPSWETDIAGVKDINQLPVAARNYIDRIEEELRVPIKFISTGADRESVIVRD